jgi:hypothetical protein
MAKTLPSQPLHKANASTQTLTKCSPRIRTFKTFRTCIQSCTLNLNSAHVPPNPPTPLANLNPRQSLKKGPYAPVASDGQQLGLFLWRVSIFERQCSTLIAQVAVPPGPLPQQGVLLAAPLLRGQLGCSLLLHGDHSLSVRLFIKPAPKPEAPGLSSGQSY